MSLGRILNVGRARIFGNKNPMEWKQNKTYSNTFVVIDFLFFFAKQKKLFSSSINRLHVFQKEIMHALSIDFTTKKMLNVCSLHYLLRRIDFSFPYIHFAHSRFSYLYINNNFYFHSSFFLQFFFFCVGVICNRCCRLDSYQKAFQLPLCTEFRICCCSRFLLRKAKKKKKTNARPSISFFSMLICCAVWLFRNIVLLLSHKVISFSLFFLLLLLLFGTIAYSIRIIIHFNNIYAAT